MVGPSITDDERRVASRRLKAGFVVLVGVSGALVALQVDATPVQMGAAALAAGVLGLLLLLYLDRLGRQFQL